MSSHSIHPDSHTNGLADDCPRCAEHANDLLGLDLRNLWALYERRVAVERGDPGVYYRSANESKAAYNLGIALMVANRLEEASIER
jgi:hypothetical protein